ncbi:hypothetical protein EUA93_15505 [Nocardioides oleivorans]|uniref:WD40 repeat domain-containing protein n=1 Tax=Nocardioides oleivorans TaxID=273676 RepID=A0A4Q2S1U6_9ACTN|nr:hypothetical protein [Nocardioides oleivorans]RYB95620.1 hypothetical protein EUA93_15505 [Nocardioides oleivorans]
MRQLRRLSVVLVAALVAVPGRADAAEGWTPLEEAGGHSLAVALGDGTTALVSVGGPDEATIYDQRRAADGTLGPATAVLTVSRADYCRPVDAATAIGNYAVAVECQTRTGLEDPPTTLVELVWTGDDGWVWQVHRTSSLGTVDYSPQGQFALFTSNSEYGRPHHVTSFNPDLGWRDVERREVGPSGDRIIGAIDDEGDVVVLRGAGFEDEPGYWFGGRLRVESYDYGSRRWTTKLTRRYPDGGISPSSIDLAAGRITATLVRSRSTGRLNGRDAKVLVLSGRPSAPRSWSPAGWSPDVLTSSAATTQDGLSVVSWQAVVGRRTAKPWFATWTPRQAEPVVSDLEWRTTLTNAARSGRAMDLSVTADGHGAITWVRHRQGADHASVAGASFRVDADGRLSEQVDVTWVRPAGVTVAVTAAVGASSVTLGRIARSYVETPEVSYSLGP